MTGILADHNLEGHVRALVAGMRQEPWREFWEGLGIGAYTMADLGLAPTTPDDELWRECQSRGLVLVTANRNNDGPDSLNAVIAAENTDTALPVMTVGDADRLWTSREYVDRVIEKLLDYLLGIENVRGAGRLYLP